MFFTVVKVFLKFGQVIRFVVLKTIFRLISLLYAIRNSKDCFSCSTVQVL